MSSGMEAERDKISQLLLSMYDEDKASALVACIEQHSSRSTSLGESTSGSSGTSSGTGATEVLKNSLITMCGGLDHFVITFDRWVKAQVQPFLSVKPLDTSTSTAGTSLPNSAKDSASDVSSSDVKGGGNGSNNSNNTPSRENTLSQYIVQKKSKKKIAPQTISSLMPSSLTHGNISRESSHGGEGNNAFSDHFPRLSGPSKSIMSQTKGGSDKQSQWPTLGGTSEPVVAGCQNGLVGKKKKKRAVLLTCDTSQSGGNISSSAWGAAASSSINCIANGGSATKTSNSCAIEPLSTQDSSPTVPLEKTTAKEKVIVKVDEEHDIETAVSTTEDLPPPVLCHQISHSIKSQLDNMGVTVIVSESSIPVGNSIAAQSITPDLPLPTDDASTLNGTSAPTQSPHLSILVQLSSDEAASTAASRRMGIIYGHIMLRYQSQFLSVTSCIVFLTKLLSVKFIHPGKKIKLTLKDLSRFPSCLLKNEGLEVFAVGVVTTILPILNTVGGWVLNSLKEVLAPIAPELILKIEEYSKLTPIDVMLTSQQQSEEEKLLSMTNVEAFLRPFDEDVDSRHEYKSPIECNIFNEREKCYDEFSNLFRQFQSVNRSDMDGSKTTEFWSNLHSRGTKVLNLNDCNYLWFAKNFKEMLLFHGINMPKSSSPFPSTDRGSSVTNRISNSTPVTPSASSQNISTALFTSSQKQRNLEERLGQGGSGKIYSNRRGTISTPMSASSTRSTSTKNVYNTNTTFPSFQRMKNMSDSLNDPSSHFPGNQQFFFRFILLMDSHRLNLTLQDVILTETLQLLDIPLKSYQEFGTSGTCSPEEGSAGSTGFTGDSTDSDPTHASTTKSFTLRVLKLRVLGKFLGLLHFSPFWNTSIDSLKESPLLDAAKVFATQRNSLQHALPLFHLLHHCWDHGSLSLCVPWVTSYMNLLAWDSASVLKMTKLELASILKSSNVAPQSPQFDYLTQHLRCISMLHAIASSDLFEMTPTDGKGISKNRVSVVFIIQSFLTEFPTLGELRNLFIRSGIPHLKSILCSVRNSQSSGLINEVGNESHTEVNMQIDDGNNGFSQSYVKYILPELFHSLAQMRQRFVAFQRSDELLCEKLIASSSIINRPVSLRTSSTKRQAPTLISPHLNVKTLASGSSSSGSSTFAATSIINSSQSLMSPPRHLSTQIMSPDHSFDVMMTTPPPKSPRSAMHNGSGSGVNIYSFTPPPLQSSKSASYNLDALSLSTGVPPLIRSTSMSRSMSMGSTQDLDLMNEGDSIQKKLEMAFWNQHPHLYNITNFVVGHVSQACRQRLRERVADLVLKAWSCCDTAASQCLDIVHNTNKLSPTEMTNAIISKHQAMVEKYTSSLFKSMCVETEEFLGEFVGHQMLEAITPILALYSMSNGVRETAIKIAMRQKESLIKSLYSFYCVYGRKKLSEVITRSVEQQRKVKTNIVEVANTEVEKSSSVIFEILGSRAMAFNSIRKCLVKLFATSCENYKNFFSIMSHSSKESDALVGEEHVTESEAFISYFFKCPIRMNIRPVYDVSSLDFISKLPCCQHRDDLRVFSGYICGMVAKLTLYCGQLAIRVFATDVNSDVGELAASVDDECELSVSVSSAIVMIRNNIALLSEVILWVHSQLEIHKVDGECTGRMKIDVMKMLTTAIAALFVYDIIIDHHAIAEGSSGNSFSYASAIVIQALKYDIINIENISQLIGYSLTHSILTTVFALLDMSSVYKRAIMAFVGRYLFEKSEIDGMDLDIDVEVCSWANDPAVRRIIKNDVSVTIGNVIDRLMK